MVVDAHSCVVGCIRTPVNFYSKFCCGLLYLYSILEILDLLIQPIFMGLIYMVRLEKMHNHEEELCSKKRKRIKHTKS